jgi:hypothetical protein
MFHLELPYASRLAQSNIPRMTPFGQQQFQHLYNLQQQQQEASRNNWLKPSEWSYPVSPYQQQLGPQMAQLDAYGLSDRAGQETNGIRYKIVNLKFRIEPQNKSKFTKFFGFVDYKQFFDLFNLFGL